MRTDKKLKLLMQGLRQQLKLPQKEIAAQSGISLMSYKRYEYGDRVPDARTAIRIARTLGTTVEALWGGNL